MTKRVMTELPVTDASADPVGGPPDREPHIRLSDVGKVFPDGTPAVSDVSLSIPEGEFLVCVGPSGSGKSTLLRMIAGLEEISEGTIEIRGRRVNDLAPKERDIAMVFQDYALYPNMDVRRNMAFALRIAKTPRDERERRVAEAAQVLGITDLLHRLPRQLSGGQRQRVAMGRAIVRDPEAHLMDEPLSNLDAKLRVHMRGEISRLHQRLRTTTIYVTHDQVEAMTMAQRIVVMRAGRVEQAGSPQDVYERPQNVFVAGFIGSPAMNLLRARIDRDPARGIVARLGEQRLVLGPDTPLARLLAPRIGGDVILGIRPEALALAPRDDRPGATLEGDVSLVERLGSETHARVSIDASAVVTADIIDLRADLEEGADEDAGTATLTARLAPNAQVAEDERIRLEVDLDALHLFDLETQRSLALP